MPRKAQSDEQNEKTPRPKEIFRLSIEIFDSGSVDHTMRQWYLNEETGKRKQLIYDSPSKYRKAIEEDLGSNVYTLATWILQGLGIDVNEFVRNIADSTVYDAPDDPDDSEDEGETEEEA